MKVYRVKEFFKVPVGTRVAMPEHQVAKRAHLLLKDGNAWIVHTRPCGFLPGEELGLDDGVELPQAKLELLGVTTTPAGGVVGKASVEGAPPRAPSLDEVVEAIGTLDRGSPEHFTKAGLPRLDVLADLVGSDVTAAARDAAWAKIEAAQADDDEAPPDAPIVANPSLAKE